MDSGDTMSPFDLMMDADLAKNEWPKSLERIKNLPHPSLCAQVMTKEIFYKYRDHKTRTGWTIARAINTGVLNENSLIGCHVGDLDSYYDFSDLFRPVIQMYHHGYDMFTMKHINDTDSSKCKISINTSVRTKIVSSRIRVARNLSVFPLNPGGTKESRLRCAELLEKVFKTLPDDLAGDFYRHSDMSDELIRQLIDQHILFRGKDPMQAASGYHQHWPHRRGVFMSKDKKFICWVNEGDHLRIISMESGSDISNTFFRLCRGIHAIDCGIRKLGGQEQAFLSDPSLGMVTCCPTNLGTGMRCSVHVRLPKLIKVYGLKELDNLARKMDCQARGSLGEHSEVQECVDISNRRRLGVTECELIQDMVRCINTLADMEDAQK